MVCPNYYYDYHQIEVLFYVYKLVDSLDNQKLLLGNQIPDMERKVGTKNIPVFFIDLKVVDKMFIKVKVEII